MRDARFVTKRGSNANGAWVIWSDGAIELSGLGHPVAGLATINFPIELPGTSQYISIAEYLASDYGNDNTNVVHVTLIIRDTLTRTGFQARCQMFDGSISGSSFSWRLYYAPF
ncbi:hypothetical protein FE392_19655 [Xenorhabdus sp. 12]|uniref:Bacteriophage protein n=1 Tax=Xenorhabdus santafensis TaxID=2582833 RepID=A0ABU4SFH1_9GAMM|nr:hypothetical protein [Xenorhabdus sp. 12]